MNDRYEGLSAAISARFGETLSAVSSRCGELTYEVDKNDLIEFLKTL